MVPTEYCGSGTDDLRWDSRLHTSSASYLAVAVVSVSVAFHRPRVRSRGSIAVPRTVAAVLYAGVMMRYALAMPLYALSESSVRQWSVISVVARVAFMGEPVELNS